MALYAVSYDEVEGLADYVNSHDITFPLLSDPDSEIIKRFEILNTEIDEDDHPWYGVPFPGVYVMDASGTIIDKMFESSFWFRPSATQILRSALGEQMVKVERSPAPGPVESVDFDVVFDGDSLPAGVLRDLVVRFAIPEEQHLYSEPVPEGMVATSVEIDPLPSGIVKPPIYPPTTTHVLSGSGESLQIFEGDVQIRVPITHLSNGLDKSDDGSLVLRVEGTVRWQACDDEACHLPRTERFSIEIPAVAHNAAGSNPDRPEDTLTHMTKLAARRTDEPLSDLVPRMMAGEESP